MQRTGIGLCAILASLFIFLAPQAMGDISALDRFLPQDTMMYFVIKDISAAKEAARETAFYEVWDSEGMRALRAEMSALWKASVVRNTKIDPLVLLQAVKKDAVLGASFHYDAALGPPPNGISFSLVQAIEDPEGEIKQIISTIKAAILIGGTPPPDLKTYQHGQAEVLSLRPAERVEISVATMPGVVLLCLGDPGLVTTLIDQGTGDKTAGFPTSEAYPSAVGFHKKGDLSLAWWNLKGTIEAIQSLVKSAQQHVDPAVLFQHLGLDNFSHLYVRTYINHRGFLTQQILGFDGPVHGLLQFFLHAGELKAVERFTPEEDFVMGISHGSLDEAWNRLRDMVRAIGGDEAFNNMNAGVEAVETTLGFSLEKDLFTSIGNEMDFAVKGERFTLLFQVLDETKLTQTIPKLLQLWELKPETVEAEGTSYSRVEIPSAGIALFYGVNKGYLTISNSPEGYLAAAKGVRKEDSIIESRRYGKALSYLPAANSFITITDLRGMANYTTTILKLQQALSKSEAYSPLDLSFLAEETFPIVEVGVAQEDRYVRWSYSESGMEYVLGAYSTLKVILSGMAAEKGKRAVDVCQADLRSIMTALESYHIDNNRYPDTLDQLLAPIAYLAKVPIDPWTDAAYVYNHREGTYILIGAGPNGKIDLDLASIEGALTKEKIPAGAQYDPSGGPGGDIIYVGP
jgi:hypothetical protein